MSFRVHTRDTAPQGARHLLAVAEQKFGFVPNLLGVLAEAPVALEAYLSVDEALSKSRLTPIEREIARIAVSVENRCEYCVAAHSTIATMVKAGAEVVAETRAGGPIRDPRLEALRRFTGRGLHARPPRPARAQSVRGCGIRSWAPAGGSGGGRDEDPEQLHQPHRGDASRSGLRLAAVGRTICHRVSAAGGLGRW